MAAAGIIAEYNPLHRGHCHQLRRIRALLGEETPVICAMSGNFVQRGDFALLPKHARAEAAVRSGADLVLEIPMEPHDAIIHWVVTEKTLYEDGIPDQMS